MDKDYIEVGYVSEIWRYPVKSMAGEPLESTRLGWHGLGGDRRFAFSRLGNPTGLPWLSARELPRLVLYRARFEDPADEESPILVTTPEGSTTSLDDPGLLDELQQAHGGALQLTQLWRGTYDSMALSLISRAAIRAISGRTGLTLEVERFRPNLLVEVSDSREFPEDRWVGDLLVFGARPDSARVRVNRKDPRCMIVNLDPVTGRQDPMVLREIVQGRKNLLGVYGSTERPGTICVGDTIRLLKS